MSIERLTQITPIKFVSYVEDFLGVVESKSLPIRLQRSQTSDKKERQEKKKLNNTL